MGASLVRVFYSVIPGSQRLWMRFIDGFTGWFVYLIPQVGVTVWCYHFYITGQDSAMLPLTLLFALPLLLAPFSPWLMLLANTFISPAVGFWLGSNAINPHAGSLLDGELLRFMSEGDRMMAVNLISSAVFVYLNWLAVRRCPEFVPEWTRCAPKQWDIRQMVDPLDIRQYAAPWQLSQPGAIGGDGEGAGRSEEGPVSRE